MSRSNNNKRKDHLLERNSIHGDAVFGEMRGRIHMGAVLSDHFGKMCCEIPPWRWCKAAASADRRPASSSLDRSPTIPACWDRSCWVKSTNSFTRDDPIGATELRLCPRSGDETKSDRSSRKHVSDRHQRTSRDLIIPSATQRAKARGEPLMTDNVSSSSLLSMSAPDACGTTGCGEPRGW